MNASKAIERLLRIRALEEEQRRASLESALGELDALKRAQNAARQSERRGRARVGASAASGEVIDRQVALVEMETARRRVGLLEPRIAASELEAARRRQELLAKRIERRQAGTLVEEARMGEEIESGRRNQKAVDDWYGARKHRKAAAQDRLAGSHTTREDLNSVGLRARQSSTNLNGES